MTTLRRLTLLPLLLSLLACSLLNPGSTPRPPLGTPTPVASPTEILIGPTESAATESAPTDTAPAPTDTEAPAPAATDTESPTAAPSPIPTRVATSSPGDIKLGAAGPWLVFSAQDGIWAANADGTGLTQMTVAGSYFRLGTAAPSGGYVTVVTGTDDQGIHGLTLWLLSLPGGQLTKVSALTDAATEPAADVDPGSFSLDPLTSLGQVDWAPDGADLAFIGAQAGPSDDLFSYNLASGKVTRLTDGPSQAYGPSWSPDRRFILQFGVKTFGSGAGYTMDGVWAAAADNSGVKTLYTPERGSGGEFLLGWTGPETFEVSSFYVSCANGKVRTFNIANGQSQPVWPDFYSQIAVEPSTGTALVAVDQFVTECNTDKRQGLFLAQPGAAPRLIDPAAGGATNLGWSPEAKLFYAFTDAGWVGYTPAGQPAEVPAGVTGQPSIAAGGKDWAWLDAGTNKVQVSLAGGAAQTVSQDAASLPTWSPDGQNLLYFSGDRLWAGNPRVAPPAATGPKVTLADADAAVWAR